MPVLKSSPSSRSVKAFQMTPERLQTKTDKYVQILLPFTELFSF